MSRPLSRSRVRLATYTALAVIVVAGVIFAGVSLASADNSAPPPPGANMTAADWPVNERGQTYGSSALAASYEDEPDLIMASATNGWDGYISREEMRAVDGSYAVHNPEEALAWNEAVQGKSFAIPVYEVDGVTVIGEFLVEF